MKAIEKEEEEVNEEKNVWRKYERVRWLTWKAKKKVQRVGSQVAFNFQQNRIRGILKVHSWNVKLKGIKKKIIVR